MQGSPKKLHSVSVFTGIFFACVLLLGTNTAYGEGFRLVYQGTAASGQAQAFIAQADDASAMHYNPAGLTQVNRIQIYGGANFITGKFSFRGSTGTTAEGDLRQPVVMPPVSHAYLSANLEDLGFTSLGPLVLGIGLNSPYGLGARWPNNGPFALFVTDATLPLLNFKPTFAYKLHDMLSIGGGLDIYTFSDLIGEGQAELIGHTGGGATKIEFNGTDTAIGFNLSGLLTLIRNDQGKPVLNFGLVYRYGPTFDLEGEQIVNGTTAADVVIPLPLPWVLGGGVAWWPIRNEVREWKVEFDIEGIGWSNIKDFQIRSSTGTVILDQPWNWRDTYTFNVGTEYKWLKLPSLPDWEIAARGGYLRSNAANPDPGFNPAIPDANWNILAVGLGLRCHSGSYFLGFISCGAPNDTGYLKAIILDLAFQAAFWESRNVSGNLISSTINGDYETTDWYIGSFSVGFGL